MINEEAPPPTELAIPDGVPQNPLVALAPAALDIMERAQIDIMIATSKKWPRPAIPVIRRNILGYATVDQETAESCIYTLKRWDKEEKKYKLIRGPSIRLAEIVAVHWQNIRAGARTIENDGRKVVAQGLCFDLENNVLMSSEAARRITNKDGRPYSEDMQIVTAAAANSIARRNAIFMVVPFAMIKPAYAEIDRVAFGDEITLKNRRDKVFNRFYSMGVTKDRILAVIGKSTVETVDLDDLTLLIGLGTAIKDKELTIEEAFNTDETSATNDDDEPLTPKIKLRDRLIAARAKRRGETK